MRTLTVVKVGLTQNTKSLRKCDDMKKLNMNNYIKVKLTPLGIDIFYHQYDDLNKAIIQRGGKPIERRMPIIDKDGFTEFQLWCFIQLYGNYIGLAMKNVVEDVSIYIDEKFLEV